MRFALLLTVLVSVGAAAQDAFFFAQDSQRAKEDTQRAREDAQRAKEDTQRAREDGLNSSYHAGTRAIDRREYEGAIRSFDQVIERKGSRSDGALYWKAYAQNKLGRRDQALATLAQLEKDFPGSRWLNDAKALEVELRQSSGHPVSPDAEGNEELKLLAINGLMSSDPSRAFPLLQKVVTDPKASPRVKERALFVIAQSSDPKARDVIFQIAKGASNPDMQLKAVEYLGVFSKGNTQALAELYATASDPAVKRAIIRGLMIAGDTDRLLSVAKSEKSPELRREAIRMLGTMRRERTGDALVSMYATESDESVKKAIIDGLFIQQNAVALVGLARKEPDLSIKRELVQRLATMRNKEAMDYLMEVIDK